MWKIFWYDLFLRLRVFILSCPYYEGSFSEDVAVVFSYTAYFMYLSIYVMGIVNRSPATACLCAALFFMSISVMAMDRVVPKSQMEIAGCSQHGPTVCEESAIIVCVTLFVGSIQLGGDVLVPAWILIGNMVACLLLGVTSVASMIYLKLYTMQEILMGVLVGSFWSLIWATMYIFCFRIWVETGQHQKTTDFLHITDHGKRYRSLSQRWFSASH